MKQALISHGRLRSAGVLRTVSIIVQVKRHRKAPDIQEDTKAHGRKYCSQDTGLCLPGLSLTRLLHCHGSYRFCPVCSGVILLLRNFGLHAAVRAEGVYCIDLFSAMSTCSFHFFSPFVLFSILLSGKDGHGAVFVLWAA